MDLGDLKIEADKLGYKLVKKTEYIHFKSCICGHNNRGRWSCPDGIFFECNNCGLRSEPGKTETEARKNWNEMVDDYINESEPVEAPYRKWDRKEEVTYD